MKNKMYLFVLLFLPGWSCSDKEEIAPAHPTYEVSFSVSGARGAFSPLQKQQSLSASDLFDHINYLRLYLYNSKGYLVGEYLRYNENTTSVFITNLEEGTYTAVAAGFGNASFQSLERLSTAQFYQYYPEPIFIDKVEFKVAASETGVVDLTLRRKVAMLALDISDQAGSEVSYVNLTIDGMADRFAFRDMLPVGNTQQLHYTIYPHDVADRDYRVHFLVPNNSESYKTTVTLTLVNIYSDVLKTIGPGYCLRMQTTKPCCRAAATPRSCRSMLMAVSKG